MSCFTWTVHVPVNDPCSQTSRYMYKYVWLDQGVKQVPSAVVADEIWNTGNHFEP